MLLFISHLLSMPCITFIKLHILLNLHSWYKALIVCQQALLGTHNAWWLMQLRCLIKCFRRLIFVIHICYEQSLILLSKPSDQNHFQMSFDWVIMRWIWLAIGIGGMNLESPTIYCPCIYIFSLVFHNPRNSKAHMIFFSFNILWLEIQKENTPPKTPNPCG